MLPNMQAGIHGDQPLADHINAAALLCNSWETGVWVTVLGHTVELRHSPGSAVSAILRGRENQRQARQSRAISPIEKQKKTKLPLLHTCLPHLNKEGAIGAFYCSNTVKGIRGGTRVKRPVSPAYREE